MNRRSFFSAIVGAISGVYAVFVPSRNVKANKPESEEDWDISVFPELPTKHYNGEGTKVCEILGIYVTDGKDVRMELQLVARHAVFPMCVVDKFIIKATKKNKK